MPRLIAVVPLLLMGCNLFADAPAAGSDGGIEDMAVAARDASPGDTSTADTRVAHDQASDLAAVVDQGRDGSVEMDAELDSGPTVDMTRDLGPDAAADMPVDMGPTDPCLWADTIFCSGFEDSTFPEWSTTFETMCGVTHETAIVRSGTGALKSDVLQGGGKCGLEVDGLDPIDNGDDIWVRAWLYVPAALTFDYVEWVGLFSRASGEEVNAGIYPDGIDGHFHLDSYSGYPEGPYMAPRDQWFCVEWNIQFDAQSGRSMVAVDGTPRVDVGALPLTLVQPLRSLEVGQVYSESGQQGAMYFDDIFVGRRRPGCD